MKPNKGYDSVSLHGMVSDDVSQVPTLLCHKVEAKVGNKPTELVVYTADAIRPAYLIIVKR